MTATQEFIKDAIEGGWNNDAVAYGTDKPTDDAKVGAWYYGNEMFLDPLAWQAVGKTRGWSRDIDLGKHGTKPSLIGYTMYWHKFIDHLTDGKTIEEALQAID